MFCHRTWDMLIYYVLPQNMGYVNILCSATEHGILVLISHQLALHRTDNCHDHNHLTINNSGTLLSWNIRWVTIHRRAAATPLLTQWHHHPCCPEDCDDNNAHVWPLSLWNIDDDNIYLPQHTEAQWQGCLPVEAHQWWHPSAAHRGVPTMTMTPTCANNDNHAWHISLHPVAAHWGTSTMMPICSPQRCDHGDDDTHIHKWWQPLHKTQADQHVRLCMSISLHLVSTTCSPLGHNDNDATHLLHAEAWQQGHPCTATVVETFTTTMMLMPTHLQHTEWHQENRKLLCQAVLPATVATGVQMGPHLYKFADVWGEQLEWY